MVLSGAEARKRWALDHRNKNTRALSNSSLEDYKQVYRFPAHTESIMEIGVGTGRAALEMIETYDRVTLVDVTLAALDVFDDVAECFLTERMDMIPHGTIDLAIAHFVFLHCTDAEVTRVIHDATRALRPGGLFQFNISSGKTERETDMSCVRKPDRCRRIIVDGVDRSGVDADARIARTVQNKRTPITYEYWEIRRCGGY